jgi:hypothetical protein
VRSIKGFDENISQLSLFINVSHLYVSILNMVSQKVVSHSFVKDWVFSYRDDTGAVVHEENSLEITPKSLMVCTIHKIWEQQLAVATYPASVVD